MMHSFVLRTAAVMATGSILLAGCAAPQKTLYQWEGYQPQVYQYFKGESKEAQVTELEAGLQKIQAKGGTPPPGYHAQLGMLYMELGKDDQMVQEFQTEKALFPESAQYMDFLLRNVKTAGAAGTDEFAKTAGSAKSGKAAKTVKTGSKK